MANDNAAQAGQDLTGAQALVSTLADCGVTVCFANPGTSEMHLVTALDGEPRIKSVLCLFEGVATGAADGFARVAGHPAMTLLHLGPGYLNGGANVHNARRGYVPMINVIGDHALSHRNLDAPLASNIMGLAAPNSVWIRSVDDLEEAGAMARAAWRASFGPAPGPVSLILPADIAWTKGAKTAGAIEPPKPRQVAAADVSAAADAIRSARKPVLLINGSAITDDGLEAAAKLAGAGMRVLTDTFTTRLSRGAGRFAPQRMQYFAEGALKDLGDADLMVVAGTKPPVAFFAYPDTPGKLVPEGCDVVHLGGPDTDSAATLKQLADEMGCTDAAPAPERQSPDKPEGELTPFTVGASLARHMPANSVVSDDGATSSLPVFLSTQGAEPHDWLSLTGGAIGQGMPVAVGAAMARQDATTVCLSGDGAGMYTVQSLWTMARENLDVVTIVFVNDSYKILNIELARTGAGNPGPAARDMLSLTGPEIDWEGLAYAQGVKGVTCDTAEAFDDALAQAMAETGPRLIAAKIS